MELFISNNQLFKEIKTDSDCKIDACFKAILALYQSIVELEKIKETIELFKTSIISERFFFTLTISDNVLSKSSQ
jgi:hypothetical protein